MAEGGTLAQKDNKQTNKQKMQIDLTSEGSSHSLTESYSQYIEYSQCNILLFTELLANSKKYN